MSERVRLLFLAGSYAVHAERRIGVFAQDARFEVSVASPHDYQIPNTFPIALPVETGGLTAILRAYARLRKAAAERRPHLVFCQTMMYPSFLALALGRPFVVTFWNGDLLWWSRSTGVERIFKRAIVTAALRRAAAITVNSDLARATCLRLGAAEARTHVIRYPGVDLDAIDAIDRDTARQRLGAGGKTLILAPRGPYPYQNLRTMIEAAPRVRAQIPDAVFVFLSSSPEHGIESFAPFQRRAAELGVADAIRWVGKVDYQTALAYTKAAYVMISLSSKDALPATVLEAMAARTPVIAGDIAPLRDWIVPGVHGLLVDLRSAGGLADAIVALAGAGPLREDCIRNARALVERKASSATEVARVKQLVLSLPG